MVSQRNIACLQTSYMERKGIVSYGRFNKVSQIEANISEFIYFLPISS